MGNGATSLSTMPVSHRRTVARFHRQLAFRFSRTSTNSRRTAPTRSHRSYRKPANSHCISRSRTSTPTNSQPRRAPPSSATLGTLVVFRVGSRDSKLLAPEFAVGTLDAGLTLSPQNRPVVAGDHTSQEPFTAWMRRGLERNHVFVEPKLYRHHGAASLIREQSR